VFEKGHSYAEEGFSTRSTLIDARSGAVLADLEDFVVLRDGARFKSVDFNFWGITFARDGNRFFATLATGGVNYLIEGDVDSKQAHIVHRDVECPSLSPDNTRIAYKYKRPDRTWQLHILEVGTWRDTALNQELRSIDDQVEWLDDGHVMYHDFDPASSGMAIWVLSTDGVTPPHVLVPFAYSPAAERSSPTN
jgi:dipeptidyl aminopeptidase/acylaminoacyl peptidase